MARVLVSGGCDLSGLCPKFLIKWSGVGGMMLRRDLVDGVKEVERLVDASKIADTYGKFVSEPSRTSYQNAFLTSLLSLRDGINGLSRAGVAVAEAFDLETMVTTRRIANVIRYNEDSTVYSESEAIRSTKALLSFLDERLPTLMGLLTDEEGRRRDIIAFGELAGATDVQSVAVLTLQRVEGERTGPPSAEELAAVLIALSRGYSSMARGLGIATPPLQVVGLDSGSDKALDLLGVGKVLEQLRLLIFGIWGLAKRKSAAEIRKDELTELVSTLECVRQAHDLLESGAIDAEEYSRIKHDILTASEALVMQNFTLPVLLEEASETHRERLTAGTLKLLPGPVDEEE